MPEYRKGPHTTYDIQYHFVWVTKYRYKVLRAEIAERTREIIRQICMNRDIHILQGHVSVDHIHLLVSCPPELGRPNPLSISRPRPRANCKMRFRIYRNAIGDSLCRP